ncbi:hypothetical protein NMG60_11000609 [Bertholletia excelsa]
MGLGFTAGVLGVVILFHAAYSTIQYRSLLKITEEEFSGPPMNVVVELILGLTFCMWAALSVPGKFHSILPYSDENRFLLDMLCFPHVLALVLEIPLHNRQRVVSFPANMDFMIFNHRGKAFCLDEGLKLK